MSDKFFSISIGKINKVQEENIASRDHIVFRNLFMKISIPLEKTSLEYHQNCPDLNALRRILIPLANFCARAKKITENTLIDNRNIVPDESSNRPENAFRKPRRSRTLDGMASFRRKRFKVLIVLHDSLPIDHTLALYRIRFHPRVPEG